MQAYVPPAVHAPILRLVGEDIRVGRPTDVYSMSVGSTQLRVSFWNPRDWARVPEAMRPGDAVALADGSYIYHEAI